MSTLDELRWIESAKRDETKALQLNLTLGGGTRN